MTIPEEFSSHVAEVVARHFANAPKPDGTTEINREHVRIKEAAYSELKGHIGQMTSDENERYELRKYAEGRAQAGIYDLFIVPIKKNRRLKGMKGY